MYAKTHKNGHCTYIPCFFKTHNKPFGISGIKPERVKPSQRYQIGMHDIYVFLYTIVKCICIYIYVYVYIDIPGRSALWAGWSIYERQVWGKTFSPLSLSHTLSLSLWDEEPLAKIWSPRPVARRASQQLQYQIRNKYDMGGPMCSRPSDTLSKIVFDHLAESDREIECCGRNNVLRPFRLYTKNYVPPDNLL